MIIGFVVEQILKKYFPMNASCRFIFHLVIFFSIFAVASATHPHTTNEPGPLRNWDGQVFLSNASDNLLRLYHEAQRRSKKTIKLYFEKNLGFQGKTEERPDSWKVTISPDYDTEHTAAVLAHELGHILLNASGYGGYEIQARRIDAGILVDIPLVQRIAFPLLNCYLDPLVDKRLRKFGIDPSPDFEEKRHFALENDHNWYDSAQEAPSRVLGLYCDSLRMDVGPQEKALSRFAPDLVKRAKALQNKLGNTSPENPAEYLRKTIALRNAIGVRGALLCKKHTSDCQ